MIYPTIAGNCWSMKVAASFLGWAATQGGAGSVVKDIARRYELLDPGEVIFYVWIVWLAVWFLAAFGRKRAEKRQPRGERVFHVAWMVAAFYLLFRDQEWCAPLNERFLPAKMWIAQLGMWATIAGAALAIWARVHLGKNWSGEVTIREDHKLIRSGPYKYIRHPIYTGMLLALAGTAAAIGEYRALLGLAMFAAGIVLKARREESMLAGEFGPAFEEHKRKTGFFLPRFS